MTFLNKVSWLRNTHVYDLKHNQNLNIIKSWSLDENLETTYVYTRIRSISIYSKRLTLTKK